MQPIEKRRKGIKRLPKMISRKRNRTTGEDVCFPSPSAGEYSRESGRFPFQKPEMIIGK
jgi:hypothetical protein